MSIVIKGKKGAGTITVESGSAVVGTRSSCTLVLEDPMAAERHAVFHEKDGSFTLEDLGSSSGTYLNGKEVAGEVAIPTAGEASIVIGVSRILTNVDVAKKVLTLNLKEASFYYDKKEDPYLWVRSEVEFGRFKPVRIGNWIGIGAVGLLFAASFVDPVSDRLVDPGPLGFKHAEAVAAKGRSDSCAECHEPLRGTPAEKCRSCHEPIFAKASHPFDWSSHSCQPCHIDHRGANMKLITTAPSNETCNRCHQRGRTIEIRTLDIPADKAWVAKAYNTFPHSSHLSDAARAKGVDECTDCHKFRETSDVQPADREANRPRREFRSIGFQECQDCHGPTKSAQTEWNVSWHGTDQGPENCTQCHATLHSKELKSVEREKLNPHLGWSTFAFLPRDHHPELTEKQKADPTACSECHRDGVVGGGPRVEGRAFPHGLHVTNLQPESTADLARASTECRECHTGIDDSPSLQKPHYAGADGKCTPCHSEERLPTAARDASAALLLVPDFPHAKHRGQPSGVLDKDCLSCHKLDRSLRGTLQPDVHEKVSDCTLCHSVHDNIGGGACSKCHQAGDPSYSNTPVMKPWPEPNAFSHKSSGHKDVKCAECHIGTESAKTLMDVRIPNEFDRNCVTCHIEREARFHFKR